MPRLPNTARAVSTLPTRDDLGPLPNIPERHIARIDAEALSAPGRGLAALGQGLTSLGGAFMEQQNKDEDAEVQRRLFQIEQEQNRHLDDSRRTVTGDPDGFADDITTDFTEAGRGAFQSAREAGLSDRALRRLAEGLSSLRERQRTRAFTHELDHRGRYGEEWTGGQIDNLVRDLERAETPADEERIRDAIRRAIETGRNRYGFGNEAERRLQGRAMVGREQNILGRRDQYATLLELEGGDERSMVPSTGNISELGLAQILRDRPRQPGQSTADRAAEGRRISGEAGRISEWITRNFVAEGEGGQRLPMTQLQHDALVGLALNSGRHWQDTLQELIPSVRTGDWRTVTSAVRAGGLTALEQPARRRESTSETPPTERTETPPTERTERTEGDVEIRTPPGNRTPVGTRPRTDRISGIVIHHTAGTTLEGALDTNNSPFRRGTGYHYYVDRDGSIYRFTPDDTVIGHVQPPGNQHRIPGAWNNLSSGNTIAISAVARTEEEVTDAQRDAIRRLTAQLVRTHGIDVRNIVGHSDIQNAGPREGVELAAELRNGRTPPPRTQPTGPNAPPPGPNAPPPPDTLPPDSRRDQIAEMLEGRSPASRYQDIPADRRRVLIGRLRDALRPEVQRDVETELELIRQTGQPTRLPDGTTHFERAARILTRQQLARVEQRLQEAVAQYNILHGMQDMTEDEFRRRLADMTPNRERDGPLFAMRQRVYNMGERAWDRMREEGQRDPARSVETGLNLRGVGQRQRDVVGPDGQVTVAETDVDHRVQPAREVREAHALIRRRFAEDLTISSDTSGNLTLGVRENRPNGQRALQEAWGIIMDARIAAQIRRGIGEEHRSPLTRGEAADLLRLPRRIADMTDDDFTRAMQAARERARERYGPYEYMALNAAIRFATMNQERSRTARDLLGIVMRGDRISQQDIERLAAQRRLDAEQHAWWSGIGETGVGGLSFDRLPDPLRMQRRPDVGGIDLNLFPPTNLRTPPAGVDGSRQGQRSDTTVVPGLTASQRQPTPERIDHLRRYPHLWRQFDEDYGDGASAMFLQRQ